MDAPTATTPTSNLRGTAPGLGPGWLALRDCALGGGGPRVGLALLHPGVGVALVESGAQDTDAVARLRRALDARRFPAVFGGYPPIVRAAVPSGRSTDLGRVLAAAFAAQPPLALAGGGAWAGAARAALEAEAPAAVPAWRRPRRGRRPVFTWRAAVLAVVGGGSAAAALASAFAPPWHGAAADTAPRRPAVVLASAAAPPGGALDLPAEASPAEGALTAPEVAAALKSAETAAAAAAEAASARSRSAPLAAAGTADGGRPEPPPVAQAAASAPKPRPAPTRTAAAQTQVAGGRRAASPGADAGGGGARCREILVRATAGETLSDGDKDFLRRGCQPRG